MFFSYTSIHIYIYNMFFFWLLKHCCLKHVFCSLLGVGWFTCPTLGSGAGHVSGCPAAVLSDLCQHGGSSHRRLRQHGAPGSCHTGRRKSRRRLRPRFQATHLRCSNLSSKGELALLTKRGVATLPYGLKCFGPRQGVQPASNERTPGPFSTTLKTKCS